MIKSPKKRTAKSLVTQSIPLLVLSALVVATVWMSQTADERRDDPLPTSNPARQVTQVPTSLTAGDTSDPATPLPRPLKVGNSSALHEWTEGDCMDPAVIERLASNPDEFIKMVEENDRIKRRQLVYRKETAALLVQQARASGEPLRQFTLPDLDGRELVVEIISSDLSPSGQSGSFHGRLAGRPESMVTLAFEFGTEAFTVLSPEDGIYLQADPREPGELIVKSIDPAIYVAFKCGNPDHQ
ncbi:MAG: hypothetical protein WED15_07435 [Akkermansiaceae bacterium]